jgi:hypothetical protein
MADNNDELPDFTGSFHNSFVDAFSNEQDGEQRRRLVRCYILDKMQYCEGYLSTSDANVDNFNFLDSDLQSDFTESFWSQVHVAEQHVQSLSIDIREMNEYSWKQLKALVRNASNLSLIHFEFREDQTELGELLDCMKENPPRCISRISLTGIDQPVEQRFFNVYENSAMMLLSRLTSLKSISATNVSAIFLYWLCLSLRGHPSIETLHLSPRQGPSSLGPASVAVTGSATRAVLALIRSIPRLHTLSCGENDGILGYADVQLPNSPGLDGIPTTSPTSAGAFDLRQLPSVKRLVTRFPFDLSRFAPSSLEHFQYVGECGRGGLLPEMLANCPNLKRLSLNNTWNSDPDEWFVSLFEKCCGLDELVVDTQLVAGTIIQLPRFAAQSSITKLDISSLSIDGDWTDNFEDEFVRSLRGLLIGKMPTIAKLGVPLSRPVIALLSELVDQSKCCLTELTLKRNRRFFPREVPIDLSTLLRALARSTTLKSMSLSVHELVREDEILLLRAIRQTQTLEKLSVNYETGALARPDFVDEFAFALKQNTSLTAVEVYEDGRTVINHVARIFTSRNRFKKVLGARAPERLAGAWPMALCQMKSPDPSDGLEGRWIPSALYLAVKMLSQHLGTASISSRQARGTKRKGASGVAES